MSANTRRRLRRLPFAGYAALVVVLVVHLHGVPASREMFVLVVLGALLTASLTSIARLRRLVVGIAVDWFPFVALLAFYDLIRGYADGLWLPAHALPQIDADRAIGLGSIPTVWLQRHLWHGGHDLRFYDYLAWCTYLTYFFVPVLVLAVLWWRSRPLFRRLAAGLVLLSFAGCATYVLYPAVPPWLAAREGLIPPVDHLFGVISGHMPFVSFQPLWQKGTRYANAVAAVPSLHAAVTLLVTLFVRARQRSPLRNLLFCWPLLMTFALVYSGEHYVTDILIGFAYATAVHLVAEGRFSRTAERAEPDAEAALPASSSA